MANKIKVRYEYSGEYKKIPVTGVWGGISPNAEIIANFFVEFQKKPKQFEIQIDNAGNVIEQPSEDEKIFIRELLIGLVMRPDIARSIGEFLISHARVGEEILAQKLKEPLQSEGEKK